MKSKLIRLLLLSLCFSFVALAAYDEAMAIQLAHISGASYCTPSSLEQKNCGVQCDYMKKYGWSAFFSKQYPAALGTSVSFSIFSNDASRLLVVAFRGTTGSTQLILELLGDGGVPYDLQTTKTNEQALVQKYFYTHYKNMMRSDMMSQLRLALSRFKNYRVIFTGHSLGGAFTTLAVIDCVRSGLLSRGSVKTYTFGSPRVGNKAFGEMHKQTVEESYRIVHYKDLVPHVPPCIINPMTKTCVQSGLRSSIWLPIHVNYEIFYDNKEMKSGSQKVCSNEDLTCSLKYPLVETNVDDHIHYFGFHISCDP